MMRVQLAQPNLRLLSPDAYNQLFSMHGITMIFLYALPMLSGFSNFLWPLLLGSRDMAFPRLNALSYWVYLCAGIFLYVSFPLGQAPNGGWFNYVPMTSKPYDPGLNIDVFTLGLIFLGISTVVGSANFVVTLLRCRAPGMSVNRLPILVWGTLTASIANLFAVPAVSLACFMLWLDRHFGTQLLCRLRRRSAVAVAASFLGVRASVGVRARPAGDGDRFRRIAGVLPPPAGRLYAGRHLDGRRQCSLASASGSIICSRPACR